MKLLTLLLCAMIWLVACSSGVPQRLPGVLKKIEVVDAINRQAMCMDGSPVAYYLEHGVSTGVHTWVIHLEGGARCATLSECQAVSAQYRSSKAWESSLEGLGILSDSYSENPSFYQTNHVLLRQCNADGWVGTYKDSLTAINRYNFLGSSSFKAIIQDLKNYKGLNQATDVLLIGASSGAEGVFQHLDWLAAQLPQANVKGVVDAGYAIETPVFQGVVPELSTRMQQYYNLHHSFVDADCASAYTGNIQRCLFPEVVMPYISTPLMIKDSQYDNVVLEKYGVFTPYDVQEKAYVNQYVIALKASLSTQPFVYSDRSFRHTLLATKGFVRRQVRQVFFSDFLAQWFYQGKFVGNIIE